MLFSICFIYNSKAIKGAILQSSHTKHPSEDSGNTKTYRNKQGKCNNKNKIKQQQQNYHAKKKPKTKQKTRDTHTNGRYQ